MLEDGDNLLTIAVNNVIDYTTLPVGGKANMMSGLMGGIGAGASEKLRTILTLTSLTTAASQDQLRYIQHLRLISMI